jgi:L,D-peptidoglycan transpeptidase YkuD (ErfK/YbiS/YcfS/YnhG family)
MTLRRRVAAVGWALALVAVVLAPGGPAPAVSAPPYHPSRLAHLGAARQVVVVTSSSWSTWHATLRAYGRDADGHWHLRLGPWRARVGARGMHVAATRRQSTLTTPAGTFDVLRAFGGRPDPGTRLRYKQVDRSDWWPYDPKDPATYNIFQPRRSTRARWRPSWAEHLGDWAHGQYRYAVVIGYNLPTGVHWSRSLRQYVARHPARRHGGGGIFLHVSGSGATAGCVSTSLVHVRRLLRWLDPARGPRIVVGPRSAITRM